MTVSSELPGPVVSAAWLAEQLGDGDLVILDCTTTLTPGVTSPGKPAREVFEAGHIPSAQFVDVQGELSDPDAPTRFSIASSDAFAKAASRFGIGKGKRVILYSTGSAWWATRVWWSLRHFGFENAAVLNGGFQRWRAEGRPVETGPATASAKAVFTPVVTKPLFVGKSEVFAAMGDEAICTVNALPAAVHAGAPAGYARTGHIPGSVNVPAPDLLDPETNLLKPLEALRAHFESTGALAADRVVVYCGAGISATGDALALTLLGHPDVVVYDGSMDEWSADMSLPIVTLPGELPR